MSIREHTVSYRNGAQVMVAGLKLREMGYRKGAEVIVTDPSGDPAKPEWRYVVTNNEHATLVSRNSEAPQWIQPGVRVRVEVRDQKATEAQVGDTRGSVARVVVSARELAEWRRTLIWMLNAIEGEGQAQAPANEGLAARIDRLRRGGRIPPDVAAFMRTVTEMRNQTEYKEKVLTPTESEAVTAAWRAVMEWRAKRT